MANVGEPVVARTNSNRMLFIDQWMVDNDGKHYCGCGCGESIRIMRRHERIGIPRFLRGHNEGRINNIDKFWEKVKKGDHCWIWTGHVNNMGYGIFALATKTWLVHRLSYELTNGEGSTKGKVVCHKCDTPKCVRPDHLFVGSQSDNMLDAAIKGRVLKKFDKSQVKKLVNLVASGVSRMEAAEASGISAGTASHIFTGLTWSHITGFRKKKWSSYVK